MRQTIIKWLSGKPAVITGQTSCPKLDFSDNPQLLNWMLTTHPPIDFAEAEKLLRRHEDVASWKLPGLRSPACTYHIRVPSLSPVEDDLAFGEIDVGSDTKWSYWAIYDGHSGWATAAILRKVLAGYVGRHLRKLDADELKDHGRINTAIESAFLQLDEEILLDALKALDGEMPPAEAMCRIAPASSGSCATLVLLDPDRKVLHVACVGDSRAVLGRKTHTNDWTAIALSTDQTGFNQDEISRINADHPGETPIDLESGRVLNCAVTRSFGDNRWKWPLDKLEKWTNDKFGRSSLSNYLTPPYLTALPVVTNTSMKPGDVIILASDGFWNHMASNEDAVYCASLWIDAESGNGKSRPVTGVDQDTGVEGGGPWPYNWIVQRQHFVADGENNLATHLIKNAFGGCQRELLRSVLSTQAPDSKEARDDATVMAIRF